MKKSFLGPFFKYGVGLVLLVVVIATNWSSSDGKPGLEEILRRPVNWLSLGIALGIMTCAMMLTFCRWFLLVRALDLPFDLRSAFRLGMIGVFYNAFLPGSVGGDILKAIYIAREQSTRRTAAVASVMMDRAIGLWALFWLVSLYGGYFWLTGNETLLSNAKLLGIVSFSAVTVAVSLACWLLLGLLPNRRAEKFAGRLTKLPKVGRIFAELWRTVWLYRQRNLAVFQALAMSLVGHTGFVLVFHFAVQTLGKPEEVGSLVQHFVIVPIGLTVQALVFTPGGLGFGEMGFGALYKILQLDSQTGVMGSLAQRVVSWALGLAGLVVYLQMQKQREAAQAAEAGGDETLVTEPVIAASNVA